MAANAKWYVEITDNGPKEVERKVFPGYVLVKMVMTDDTWHLVRNIRGATGFVGSGNKAIPLTDEEIPALGEPFDPNLHNAVMHVEDESLGENTVAEVFQAGFKLGDKVIRFSMVKVAN